MITIRLIGDRELVAWLDALPGRLGNRLTQAVTRLGFALQRRVRAEKLSGRILKIRTGSRRSSIKDAISQRVDQVAASTATNIRYSPAHEYAVEHHWLIAAKASRTRRCEPIACTLFAGNVRQPALPERSFLRSALRKMQPQIEAGLHDAVADAIHG